MIKALIGFLMFASLIIPVQANAHVLLKDDAANIGAIVHINPDDDPVAGEETQIYIDIQDSDAAARIPREAYLFYVADADNNREQVKTSVSGTVIAASHVFKTKGLYTLEVVSDPNYDSFQKVQMSYALRVSRGVGVSNTQQAYSWAELGFITTLVIIGLIGIYGWNNRKEILANSKF